MSRQSNTGRLVRLSLLAAAALIIFVLEAQIPPIIPYIPGMKIGLANIITLFLLATHSRREAFMVLIVRIILGSFFAGQMAALMYSLAGGMLSFAAMCVVMKLAGKEHLWFIGVTGGVFHNIGQIIAARILMQTAAVYAYIPYLILFGITAGLFCGLCSQLLVRHFRRIFCSGTGDTKKP